MFAATPAYDNATTINVSNQQNPSASHTRNSNCTDPTQDIAITSVGWQDDTGSLSSVTYGGSGMTQIGSTLDIDVDKHLAWYRLLNPANGSSTVQANFSESINGITVVTRTYCNVNQSAPLGTPVSYTDTVAPVSQVVSSATGELVIDAAYAYGGVTITVGAGQTQRANVTNTGNHTHGASEEAGAASVTMSWTLPGGDAFLGALGVSLKPSVDAATCTRFMLLGAGC